MDKAKSSKKSKKSRDGKESRESSRDIRESSKDAQTEESFRKKKESKVIRDTLLRAPPAATSIARTANASAELARVTLPKSAKSLCDSFFAPFSPQVYANLHALQRAARAISAETAQCEFVVFGWNGAGKSALIEAMLGIPMFPAGQATMRPTHIAILQNAQLDVPRYAVGTAQSGMQTVTLDALPGMLASLNASFDVEPVHVRIERPACVSMTIIDTPGLGGSDGVARKAQTLVSSMGAPGRRFICVEAAPDVWKPSALRAVLADLDARGSRTTFVYTCAHMQFRNLRTHQDALDYVQQRAEPTGMFVAGLSLETRREIGSDTEMLQLRIVQAQQRLINLAASLGLKADDHDIGLKCVLDRVYRIAVEHLERQMPLLVEQHRAKTTALRAKLHELTRAQDALQPHLLRAAAARWAASYAHAIGALVSGSAAADVQGGQTLADERAAAPSSSLWATGAGESLDVACGAIPGAGQRLLGAQQLHRLAHEFRAACSRLSLNAKDIDAADVATANGAGPSSAYQRIYAASDIASRAGLKLFGPLVRQLFERAVSIVARLPDFAVKLANAPTHKMPHVTATGNDPDIDVSEFPFVLFRVRDALATTVRGLAADSARRCLDELRCFFIETMTEKHDTQDVAELAHTLFEDMRARVIDNIVIKYQCFFVSRCTAAMMGAVHSSIAVMTDEEAKQVFRSDEYHHRLESRIAIQRIELRRVADSQDRLESRLVQSDDPAIRKSFIVRQPKSGAKEKATNAELDEKRERAMEVAQQLKAQQLDAAHQLKAKQINAKQIIAKQKEEDSDSD